MFRIIRREPGKPPKVWDHASTLKAALLACLMYRRGESVQLQAARGVRFDIERE